MKKLLLVILLAAFLGKMEGMESYHLPGAMKKMRPQGLVYLLSGYTLEKTPDLNSVTCFDNPNAAGVVLRAHWNRLEQIEGTIDWTYFDHGIELARKSGKFVSLEVVASSHTPDWVYQAGAKSWMLTTPHTGKTSRVPLPWDLVYLAKWRRFVHEFALRYDTSPTVAYITLTGAGRGDEVHFVTTPQDVALLNSAGGSTVWLSGARQIVDIYAQSFTNTPFVLATGFPVPGKQGTEILAQLLNYGLKKYSLFGFAPHSLWSNSKSANYAIELMPDVTSEHVVGFQMYQGVKNNPDVDLESILNFGIQKGAHFIEVYPVDFSPENATLLASVNRQLLNMK